MMGQHDYYSEEGFVRKGTKYAKKVGREVIEKALWLFYALQSPETPLWAKTVITGALGYFINPVDVVPDMIPVVGFADDLAVMAAAMGTVITYIDGAVRFKAEQTLRRWFGA